MKNNKLISVLLALLVCLSMVVSASATSESDLAFTLESSDSFVESLDAAPIKAGETFTVTVNLEKNPGVLVAIGYVEFDAKKLELVSAKASVENVLVPESAVTGRLTVIVGDMRAAFTPAEFTAVTATGAVAELTFKVLEETDVVSSIKLTVDAKDVVDAKGKNAAISVEGDVLNVNVVSAGHDCGNYKTTDDNKVEPTCTEAGKAYDKICSHCAAVLTKGEEIAATGHTWDEGTLTTAPTCSAMGVREYKCTVCEATQVDENVPATGEHTYGDWTVKTEATTEAEGVEVRACTVCGNEETRSIAKLPPVAEPEPKSNTLVIVVAVLVVLAGAGVAAYFVLKNKKK